MAEGDSEYAVRTNLSEPLRCSLYKCRVQVVVIGYVFTSTKGCWVHLKLVLRIDFPLFWKVTLSVLSVLIIQMFENVDNLRAVQIVCTYYMNQVKICKFNLSRVCQLCNNLVPTSCKT